MRVSFSPRKTTKPRNEIEIDINTQAPITSQILNDSNSANPIDMDFAVAVGSNNYTSDTEMANMTLNSIKRQHIISAKHEAMSKFAYGRRRLALRVSIEDFYAIID